jgi:hypothetical protein
MHFIFYLFKCLLNSPNANYKVSTSTRKKQSHHMFYIQIYTQRTNKCNLNNLDSNKRKISESKQIIKLEKTKITLILNTMSF